MENVPKKNLVSEILVKVAKRIGAEVLLEPEYGFAGRVKYKSGVQRYFRASSLDMNHLGASEIARDKDYANFFMADAGFPTIEGQTFFKKEFCEALGSPRDIDAGYDYARSLGFPVFVKPNSKSQGNCVAKVHDKKTFYRAMREAFKSDRVVLVQRPAAGKDYRIVVLDDRVISAYERTPLFVVGDGKSAISELLLKKQRTFEKEGRDTVIKVNDYRIIMELARHKMKISSILPKGERMKLLNNANLSSGGDSVDVTGSVHKGFEKIAVSLTKTMGLRLCGVDLMIDGDIKNPPANYKVIEINSAPGLDNYFAIGPKQEKIVEDLYEKVLKAME